MGLISAKSQSLQRRIEIFGFNGKFQQSTSRETAKPPGQVPRSRRRQPNCSAESKRHVAEGQMVGGVCGGEEPRGEVEKLERYVSHGNHVAVSFRYDREQGASDHA